MKNIHILPTDKLSKLYKVKEKFYIEEYPVTTINAGNQNIYITNDEEIKEGEISYIIDKQNNIRKVERVQTKNIGTPSYYCNSHSCDSSVSNVCYSIPIEDCKKIILTTDEDLIKDCVQAIDDKFLEWFIKNPSCEELVKEFAEYYKNIPLVEEPKQETIEEVELAILFHNTYERLALSFGYETRVDTKSFDTTTPNGKLMIAVSKEIIKWQTERMYSEEDMLNFAWFLHENIGQYSCDRTAHFEGDYLKQFKKK